MSVGKITGGGLLEGLVTEEQQVQWATELDAEMNAIGVVTLALTEEWLLEEVPRRLELGLSTFLKH